MSFNYYILSPYQKVELYTATILFFVLFLILRPILFGESVNGPYLGNILILFFIWYGLTLIMTNAMMITSDKMSETKL